MIEWTRGFVACVLITTHIVRVDTFGSRTLWEVFALDWWSMRTCPNSSQCYCHLPIDSSKSMFEQPFLHRLLEHVISKLFPIALRHKFGTFSKWLLAVCTDDWFRSMTVFSMRSRALDRVSFIIAMIANNSRRVILYLVFSKLSYRFKGSPAHLTRMINRRIGSLSF